LARPEQSALPQNLYGEGRQVPECPSASKRHTTQTVFVNRTRPPPFKGKAHPVEGVEGKLAGKTTAAGQVLRTALTAKGVQAQAESRPGPRVTFELEVQMTGAGTFIESGRISYGKAGGVTFIQTRRSSVSCPSASQKPPY